MRSVPRSSPATTGSAVPEKFQVRMRNMLQTSSLTVGRAARDAHIWLDGGRDERVHVQEFAAEIAIFAPRGGCA